MNKFPCAGKILEDVVKKFAIEKIKSFLDKFNNHHRNCDDIFWKVQIKPLEKLDNLLEFVRKISGINKMYKEIYRDGYQNGLRDGSDYNHEDYELGEIEIGGISEMIDEFILEALGILGINEDDIDKIM